MRFRPALVVFIAALAAAGPAHAQGTLTTAADELRQSPVYVDPDAERALSDGQADRLRRLIRSEGAGPMYVVVLPGSATDQAGGDPSAVLRDIARDLGEPGTYAGVIGDSFRAGSVGVDVPASELAGQSLETNA